MKKHSRSVSTEAEPNVAIAAGAPISYRSVAKSLDDRRRSRRFVGCHEETVRRAYLRGLLTSQRFGVRSRRFHPRDVLDWIGRGAPTRVS